MRIKNLSLHLLRQPTPFAWNRLPSRHRFLEPIHNVKEGQSPITAVATAELEYLHPGMMIVANTHAAQIAAGNDGGACRDRTDDLKLAKLALSQLS